MVEQHYFNNDYSHFKEPVYLQAYRPHFFYDLLKRVFDFMVSALALLLLAPILLFVAILIKLDSAGPALFRQTRIGKDGKSFTIYKFRSMYVNSDDKAHREAICHFMAGKTLNCTGKAQFKLQTDRRITRMGKFIRKTSIDELPQLINVLKGNMSLVGPRPPLSYEVEKYSRYEMQRLSVIPGMTGLWQVKGRSQVTFEEMINMDLEYISNRNFSYDLSLIFQTVPAVLFGSGAA